MMMTLIVSDIEPGKTAQLTDADAAIVDAAAKGERSGRRRLIQRVLPRVEQTVRFLAKERSDTDDLIQLALVEVVRSIRSFKGDAALDYWVDRVTLRTSAKQFQRRRRRAEIRERYFMPPSCSMAVDEEVALRQVRERLQTAFGKLKEKQRVPVALHFVHGYEATEIAELTGEKLNTVRGRLRRGMAKLRQLVMLDPGLREWIEEGE